MKKVLLAFISLVLMLSVSTVALADDISFALVTDVGNIDDQTFNQSAWEGLVAFADANGLVKDEDYAYYKPSEDSDAVRIESITAAVDNGAKVIVLPGYLFNAAVLTAAAAFPEVVFVGIDLTIDPAVFPANVINMQFQEEQSGFFAGYAAVKDGYTKLGFLGGIDVPAVVRYGFGYLQGIEYAAQELGVTLEVKYWYSGAFWPTDEIKAKMDSWYAEGTQIVFSCGGGIFLSCLSAAETADGYMIGVDTNQGGVSERMITSAMKLIPAPMNVLLQAIKDNDLIAPAEYAGKDIIFNTSNGACGLPTDEASWRFNTFTVEEYQAIVDKVLNGDVVISNSTDAAPITVSTAVDFQN
ncbi:MAG: BMP family ABC transporter substrate-binding protein [Bacillota bacterium]